MASADLVGVAGSAFPPPPWADQGAVPPGAGGQPAERRSFATAVSHCVSGGNAFVSPIPLSFANLEGGSLDNGEPVGIKVPIVINGSPTLRFSKEEVQLLSKPLDLSLVGKFGMGRPKWDALVRFFRNLRLFGSVNLASLDTRHCLISLSNMDDYTRLFSKGLYLVNNFSMKIFKWTKDFKPNAEPSLVPVWITLPGIGAQMFTQNILFSIASAFGKPLKVAYSTAKGKRGDNARILVEVDVLISHPSHVTLEEDGVCSQQPVVMDPLPKYCTGCKRMGHSEAACYIIHPELKKEYIEAKEAMKAARYSRGRVTPIAITPNAAGGEAPGGFSADSGNHMAGGQPELEEGEVVLSGAQQAPDGRDQCGSGIGTLEAQLDVDANSQGAVTPPVADFSANLLQEFDLLGGVNQAKEAGSGVRHSQGNSVVMLPMDQLEDLDIEVSFAAAFEAEIEQIFLKEVHSKAASSMVSGKVEVGKGPVHPVGSQVAVGLGDSQDVLRKEDWETAIQNGVAYGDFIQDIGGKGVLWSEIASDQEDMENVSGHEDEGSLDPNPVDERRLSLDAKFKVSPKGNSGKSGRPKKKKTKGEGVVEEEQLGGKGN